MNGWISLHRSLVHWEWYDDHNTARLFIHLLLKANHKQTNYRGVVIPAGSLVTGRKVLAIETGLTEQRIRTSLIKLKSTNEITIKSNRQNSIISLKNWSKYQTNNQPINQQPTNDQPTINQQVTTSNKIEREISGDPVLDAAVVAGCRSDMKRIRVEDVAMILKNSANSHTYKQDLEAFIIDAANSEEKPKNFTGMLRSYMMSNGKKSTYSKPQQKRVRGF